MRSRRALLALVAVLCLLGAGTAFAAFSKTTSSSANVVTAKRIFPGVRSSTAWDLGESISGTFYDGTDALFQADGLLDTTGSFTNAFSSSRYVDVDLQGTRPAGVAVTGANVVVRFAASSFGVQGCFYFDLRRTSTSALLSTYGSGSVGGAVGCVTGTTQTTFTTSVTVPTADVNDLTIRIYGYSGTAGPLKLDLVELTGTSAGNTFSMYEQKVNDRATGGTAVPAVWALLAQDNNGLQSGVGWSPSYSATHYLQTIYPVDFVPPSAVVTSVTLTHRFRSAAGTGTACAYYEVYSPAGALLGTHGSTTSGYGSCSSGGVAVTHTVALPEVTTAAQVNGLKVRAYMWESNSQKTNHDWIQINVNYYLD
jgi:predicted ribosomally synthesized peptide with SipW-like signal peptide